MARLIEVPDQLVPVPEHLLCELAGPPEPKPKGAAPKMMCDWSLESWLRTYLPDAEGPKPWKGAGAIWTIPVCPFNPDHTGGSAYVGQLPGGAITAGCHHNSCSGWGWHELRAEFEPRQSRGTSETGKTGRDLATLAGTVKNGGVLVMTNLAGVEVLPIEWLWPGFIPKGMLTVIAGDPGGGKSTLSTYIAAVVTKGWPWVHEFNPPQRQPGRVLFLSAEDDTARTLCPGLRLRARTKPWWM